MKGLVGNEVLTSDEIKKNLRILRAIREGTQDSLAETLKRFASIANKTIRAAQIEKNADSNKQLKRECSNELLLLVSLERALLQMTEMIGENLEGIVTAETLRDLRKDAEKIVQFEEVPL